MNPTILVLATLVAGVAPRALERISLRSDRAESDGPSQWPSVSADGRFVAFGSAAGNLVPGDKNRRLDVFLRDRKLAETERVSLGERDREGNDDSYMPSVSGDGRLVAFVSVASNFVLEDVRGTWDVFVRDRKAGSTQCVSLDPRGTPGTGTCGYPSLSSDGRFVAFQSDAKGLVAGRDSGCMQIYVRDLTTQQLECVSVTRAGDPGPSWSSWPSISGDGRYVVFVSTAGLDGREAFASGHVFVRDRQKKTTARASVGAGGVVANAACDWASISGDGRYVAFRSEATNLGASSGGHSNIFLRDLIGESTTWVSHGPGGSAPDGPSLMPCISPDARFVGFTSWATNLLPGDVGGHADVFRWERSSDQLEIVSARDGGKSSNGSSRGFGLSKEGQIVFESEASDLVAGDQNGAADIFLADP